MTEIEKKTEPKSIDNNSSIDTGLLSLVMMARFYQVAADAGQLAHHYGSHNEEWSDQEIVIAARHLKLKARSLTIKPEKLGK